MADIKVRDKISLTSPSGDRYLALWDGSNRTVKKRLAMYAYAGINGQVVDDYGCDSITYPMTLIFSGEDHRKIAKDFFRSFQEKGKWTVTHPTDGLMGLQGVQATENDQPIKEANITRIETEWIEYINPVTLKTLRNSMIEMGIVTQQLEDETAVMAIAQMEMDAAGTLETKNSLKNVVDSVKAAYNRAQYASQEAADRQTEFLDYLTEATITAAGVVSQVQNIINAPARALNDLRARFNVLKDIINDLFGSDRDPVEPNRNDAIVREAAAAAVLVAVSQGVTVASEDEPSGLGSRVDLLDTMAAFVELVDIINVGMDRVKEQFDERESTVEEQYTPFEQTGTVVKNVIAKTQNALREQFFKLPTETRIVTRRPMSVLSIAKEYYGTTGIQDDVLDKIEQSNNLSAHEILLLPAGRQLRIYV